MPTYLRDLRRRARRMIKAAVLHDPQLGSVPQIEVSLVLTTDAEMQRLNATFRQQNKPTDVLAFPAPPNALPGGAWFSGDVIISVETARRQAPQSLEQEIDFLWGHGFCHLLGYDHPNKKAERRMTMRMTALLAEGSRRSHVRAA